MTVLLLCVDGSVAATAATHVAINTARDLHARVVALFVVEDSGLAARVDEAIDGHGSGERLVGAGEALLARVTTLAAEAGVEVERIVDQGEPFERILERARAIRPDMIVMGRTGRRGPGRALVGSEVEHVLEFTEWPVLVVPEA
ncbi:MAG TPA: universal stress protein [Acidimicrobiia bacterium]|nr:universal stress protein [Acidimicrobiia bacterium]